LSQHDPDATAAGNLISWFLMGEISKQPDSVNSTVTMCTGRNPKETRLYTGTTMLSTERRIIRIIQRRLEMFWVKFLVPLECPDSEAIVSDVQLRRRPRLALVDAVTEKSEPGGHPQMASCLHPATPIALINVRPIDPAAQLSVSSLQG
jgi:hypothetical protein